VKITRLEGDVQALLAQVGELRAFVEQKLSERERVLVGWKEIAAYVGRSVRHAQRMADVRIYVDPLPCRRDGGFVVAYASQIEAWKARTSMARRMRQTRLRSKIVAAVRARREVRRKKRST
jgi:hypothetical protein